MAHLINDKIIANTVCLYIYYNLTYISQLSYYYSITLLHISAQNWFICLNHSSNLFIALIEKWERKKTRQKYCSHHKKVIYNVVGFEYVKYKKDICECCGFIPEDPCQLTVDHYDGDHYNNDPSNLITLCHNCHALKTFKQKDNLNRYKMKKE